MKRRSDSPHVQFGVGSVSISLSLSALLMGLAVIPVWAIPLPDNSTTATSSTAFQITNNGTGKAGQFALTDPTNASPALTASSPGTGYGLFSLMTGTGRAGYFQINNPNNTNYALGGISNGAGFGVYGYMTGTGRAGHFEIANPNSINAALSGTSNGTGYGLAGFMYGTGRAGYFQISNASSPRPALEVTTNGSGSAVKAIAGGTGLAGEFQGKVTATGMVTLGGTLASSSNALEFWTNGVRLYRLEKPAPIDDDFSPNVIGGDSGNTVVPGVIGATIAGGGVAGGANQVNNIWGTVSGGLRNTAAGGASTVSGGEHNIASGANATVSGGRDNTASNYSATVSGGLGNTASGYTAIVSGGFGNIASGDYSFAGGLLAHATHTGSFVWGDSTPAVVASSTGNEVTFRASGGVRLLTSGAPVTVAGPLASSGNALELWANGARLYRLEKPDPNANPFYGFSPNLIGGYSGNVVTAGVVGATLSGGGNSTSPNEVSGQMGAIGGGLGNSVAADLATVGGGYSNYAGGANSVVGGGSGNSAYGESSVVSGGYHNTGSAQYSIVSGGLENIASGNLSTVSGGRNNIASGGLSFASGAYARATHNGSFVWSDGSFGSAVSSSSSSVDNEFTVRAVGGVRFFTARNGSGDPTAGVQLASGGSQWLVVSDRNMKNHFRTLNPKQVLDKLTKLPITEWSYKSQDPSIRHIGPMAQDFYAAFGLGEDKLRIGTMDADGVMMAAIQGLNAEVKARDKRIAALEKKNADIEARLARLERLLTQGKAR